MRIATIPFQRTMRAAMQVSQGKLAITQAQIASGKKAQDLKGLGGDAVRTLSTRSLLETQDAQGKSATRLGTTLSLYDTNITNIDTAGTDLRTSLLTAIGTGQTGSLQGAVESAFGQIRAALNATDGTLPLFAGAQIDSAPFVPATLADTIGATPDTAFRNDDVRASARVADGVDVTYGIGARQVGTGMLAMFRTLAEAGTIGTTPTATQMEAMKTALGQLDGALPQVRTVNSDNGQRQAQVETYSSRADDRKTLLTKIIADSEEVDYGQLSNDLEQQKMVLAASYSVFSQLSSLSLANYLK